MTFTSDTPFEKKPKSPEGSWGKSSDTPTQDSSWRSKDNPADASKWKQKEPAQATEKSWASSSKKPQSTSLEDQVGTNKLDTPDYDSVENRRAQARGRRDEYHINRLQSNIDKNQKWVDEYRNEIEEARKKFGDDHWHTKGLKRDLARREKEIERFSREKEDAMNKDNPEYQTKKKEIDKEEQAKKKERDDRAREAYIKKKLPIYQQYLSDFQSKVEKAEQEGGKKGLLKRIKNKGNKDYVRYYQNLISKLTEELQSLENSRTFEEAPLTPETMSFAEAKGRWSNLGYDLDSGIEIPEGWKTYYS